MPKEADPPGRSRTTGLVASLPGRVAMTRPRASSSRTAGKPDMVQARAEWFRKT
jgi:hypothetical protein